MTNSPDAAENYPAYYYALRNHQKSKNNMNINTDSPDASGDNAASPNSLILYSSFKRKIDPMSMLKL